MFLGSISNLNLSMNGKNKLFIASIWYSNNTILSILHNFIFDENYTLLIIHMYNIMHDSHLFSF